MKTWTFDERLALYEHKQLISPPFSEAERAMAHAASAAFFYALHLREMPPQDHTGEDGLCATLDFGILHLLYKPCHDFLYISGAFRRLYPVGSNAKSMSC